VPGKEQKELFAELTDLIKAHAPRLLQQRSRHHHRRGDHRPHRGRAAVPQRSMLRSARRHSTDPSELRQDDPSPPHRGGDRQLNPAIHIIALGRIAWNPETRAYTARRVKDGKTKREAIRCLKRHIARQIWHRLYNTQPAAPVRAQVPAGRVAVGAPALMPCTR
jgi:hypothetical protein